MERKDYPLEKIRNMGFVAHIDAGKTTVTERILYYTGIVHQMGEVHEGSATMDWMEQEKERGITITSAATTCYWDDNRINIIDTPGHVDFTVEVERSLRVLDGAVVIFCGVAGVEPQSETVWHQADHYKIPRIAFINKLDRTGADYFYAIDTIKSKLKPNTHPVQVPLYKDEEFMGILDIVNWKAIVYDKDFLGHKYSEYEPKEWQHIDEDVLEKAKSLRSTLIEKLADFDENILNKFLKEENIKKEELHSALRKATISNEFVPVLCGSALKNKGIQPLLKAIIKYLPSPLEVPPIIASPPDSEKEIKIRADESLPFAALAFKSQVDSYVGKLTYLRAYSGKIERGDFVLNVNTGKSERITRIIHIHANKKVNVDSLRAGEIVAVVGLHETTSGDSITDKKHPVVLERIPFAEPVMSIVIEPKRAVDEQKIDEVLPNLLDEDPTYHVKEDEETGQMIISGMGELHLEILIDRLKREYDVEVNVGKPHVNLKETIKGAVESKSVLKRTVNGKGQFAEVKLRLEHYKVDSESGGQKVWFKNKTSEEEIPKQFIRAVEAGVKESALSGLLTGNKVEDIKVTLIGGSFNEVDSSEIAFKIASAKAFVEALKKADLILLEPIMKITILTPEDYLGRVINDLNGRRGKVSKIKEKDSIKIIHGVVPLRETFGYSTSLRSVSQGRASYSMEFYRYEKVPENISKKIIKKLRGY
ncbi:MAG: elongation factor G [Candidatus Cloacimonetes bacterium]|nr:elongation factor G [Candidatus Cloacimonadota bacterium]MBS3766912.1 elongation factor G [Candidatus Cloacimonadota bacterium]